MVPSPATQRVSGSEEKEKQNKAKKTKERKRKALSAGEEAGVGDKMWGKGVEKEVKDANERPKKADNGAEKKEKARMSGKRCKRESERERE